jgi:hypothetical protein
MPISFGMTFDRGTWHGEERHAKGGSSRKCQQMFEMGKKCKKFKNSLSDIWEKGQ